MMTEQAHRELMEGYFSTMALALKGARDWMRKGEGATDWARVKTMLEMIEYQAQAGLRLQCPVSAKQAAAHAAKHDQALQDLIKRASKPTPIRAKKAGKAAKAAKEVTP